MSEDVSRGLLRYPERILTGNAKVSDGVVRNEINDLVQLVALNWLPGVELVKPV